MLPPEGFDLPISRIEEGADAGRGNARTQPRARDCHRPRAPPNFELTQHGKCFNTSVHDGKT